MKNIILLIIFILCVPFVNAQCISDAGTDPHRCSADSTIQLGGSPTAGGGTPPYTYAWSIDPIPFIPPTIPYLYASHLLDDTTIANPTLIYNSVGDSVTFYLRVTDSAGCVSFDTCRLTTSNFGVHLIYWEYHICTYCRHRAAGWPFPIKNIP